MAGYGVRGPADGSSSVCSPEVLVRKLLLHWLVIAAALWATAYFVRGVEVRSLEALAIAALVVGLVNALVRPVLAFFAFPLTLLTLGLFYLLINGVCFGLAAFLVEGFVVHGIRPAVLGALSTSVISAVLGWLLGLGDDEEDDRERKRRRKRRDRERRRD